MPQTKGQTHTHAHTDTDTHSVLTKLQGMPLETTPLPPHFLHGLSSLSLFLPTVSPSFCFTRPSFPFANSTISIFPFLSLQDTLAQGLYSQSAHKEIQQPQPQQRCIGMCARNDSQHKQGLSLCVYAKPAFAIQPSRPQPITTNAITFYMQHLISAGTSPNSAASETSTCP